MQTLELEHHHAKVKAESGQHHFVSQGILKSAHRPPETERHRWNRLSPTVPRRDQLYLHIGLRLLVSRTV